MTVTANRVTARRLIERLEAGDFDGAAALMTGDMIWWDPIRGETANTAYLAAARDFSRFYAAPIRMTVHSITAEEDRVAMELESHVPMTSGLVYNNRYHLLLRFRDGRIARIHEYLDSRHVMEVVASLPR